MRLTDDRPAATRLIATQRALLLYLVEHPDAKDTVEGIVHWWLAPAQADVAARTVNAALEDLHRRNWISMAVVGNATIYGLQKAQLGDIRLFLEKAGVDSSPAEGR